MPAPAEAVAAPEPPQQPKQPKKTTTVAKSAEEIAAHRKRRKMAWLEKKGDCVRASDGSLVSKRTANQMAFLDEYNRKFLAKVEAADQAQPESSKGDAIMDEEQQRDAKENAPMAHVVMSSSSGVAPAPSRPQKIKTKARPRSPAAKYVSYPPGAAAAHHYYAYHHHHQRMAAAAYHHQRRVTHGKYLPPTSPSHRAYPTLPPPGGPVPIYVAPYHHHHSQARSLPPPQHSLMPTAVARSVSDDDRSTPSPELSPSSLPSAGMLSTAGSSSSSLDDQALQSKEQEAIAAMLFLSHASTDMEIAAPSMLMSQ
jgi:hypothetical protein